MVKFVSLHKSTMVQHTEGQALLNVRASSRARQPARDALIGVTAVCAVATVLSFVISSSSTVRMQFA